MPALPWIKVSTAEPGAELTVLATRLPLRKHRHIPGFMRWTMRIRGQLGRAPGLVGYSLDAHLLGKTFWTVSAWTGQATMEDFVRQDPHAAGMAAIRPHMGRSTFVFWTVTPEELPLKWARRPPPRRGEGGVIQVAAGAYPLGGGVPAPGALGGGG